MVRGGKQRGSEKKKGLSKGEARLLRQLLVCLVLFAAVFVGRGVDFAPVQSVTATVEAWMQKDTDFQAVFSRMGEAFSKGEPAVETFKALWDGVTGGPDAPEEPKAPAGEAKIV